MKFDIWFAEMPIDTVGASMPVRPGRSRTRTKEKIEEKVKGGPDARKKAPPTRKAPSRGRYVDEYARPPHA